MIEATIIMTAIGSVLAAWTIWYTRNRITYFLSWAVLLLYCYITFQLFLR